MTGEHLSPIKLATCGVLIALIAASAGVADEEGVTRWVFDLSMDRYI